MLPFFRKKHQSIDSTWQSGYESSDYESSDYEDAMDSITGIRASSTIEMHEFIAEQARAENDPASLRNTKKPTFRNLARARVLS